MNGAVAVKNGLLATLAVFGSLLARALGGWDAALGLLVLMMLADYSTGFLLAALWKRSPKSENGALDSKAGFRGIAKKVVILLMVCVGERVDVAIGADYVRNAVIFFFVGNEGVSLLENAGLMGVPFPPAMKRALEALRDKDDSQTGGE